MFCASASATARMIPSDGVPLHACSSARDSATVRYPLLLAALLSVLPACATPPPATPRSDGNACGPVPPAKGLRVTVLGSGGPVAAGRAATGYLIELDGAPRVLVDAGPGTFGRFGEMRLDASRLDLVLLTHLHVDHVGELPGLVKSRDLSGDDPVRFRVFGPAGRGVYPATSELVKRLFGEQGAFAYLSTFRNPIAFEPTDLPLDGSAPPRTLLDEGGLRVTSVVTDHGDAPSIAYRIDAAGRSVVFSGDMAAKSDALVRLAAGADLLVMHAVVLDPPRSPGPLYALHASPARIGEVAAAAHVRSVVLSHLPEAVLAASDDVLASVARGYAGEVRLAADCLRVDLPRLRRHVGTPALSPVLGMLGCPGCSPRFPVVGVKRETTC